MLDSTRTGSAGVRRSHAGPPHPTIRRSRAPLGSAIVSASPAAVPDPATVDLLGVLAYGELSAFDRLAEDARTAPTLAGRAALSSWPPRRSGTTGCSRITCPASGSRSSTRCARSSRRSTPTTRPPLRTAGWSPWSRPTSATGWPPTSTARSPAGCPSRPVAWSARCSATPGTARSPSARSGRPARPAGRPATGWRSGVGGLLGEAVTQAQHVIAERDELAEFIVHGSGDVAGITGLLKRVQTNHGRRMSTLGLA